MRIHSTSSERARADAETNSSRNEAASVCAFDAYLNSLHLTAAAEASATASAKSDVTAFAEALVDVERYFQNAWDIISKYPLIVEPVSRIISRLPCTQVSAKLVLRENRVRMGNESSDASGFMRTNKSV